MAGDTFLSTGIGSLPFASVDMALDHVFERYTIPFFPQLPALNDGELVPMLAEATTPAMRKALIARDAKAFTKAMEQAVTSADAALSVVHAMPGFHAFLDRLEHGMRFKVQHVGPVTFAALVSAAMGELASKEWEVAAWAWIERLTQAWIMAVRVKTHAPLILIWDDGLLVVDERASVTGKFDLLRKKFVSQGVALGLHSCASGSLQRMTAAFPGAYLALDLNVVDFGLPEARRAAEMHVAGSGGFLFGVFDTRQRRLDVEKGRRLSHLVKDVTAAAGGKSAAILSGGCGTGLRDDAFEITLAQALAEFE